MRARLLPGGRAVVLAAAVVASASTAWAQGAAPPEPNRGHVTAGAGIVAHPTTGSVLSFEFVETVRPAAQAYVTFSYYDDVMRDTLRDDLDLATARLRALTGDRWDIQGRDRAMTFTGGGRFVVSRGSWRPFIGGGAGVIFLKRQIRDGRLGDVAEAVFNEFGAGEADLARAPRGLTRALVEAVGGVDFVRGRATFEIGYRYRAAIALDRRLDISQVSAGIGYRF